MREKKRGRTGKGVVVFFFNCGVERMVSSLSPLKRGALAPRKGPRIVLFYLERGQGLVAAPHGVNERGEHPSASVDEGERG